MLYQRVIRIRNLLLPFFCIGLNVGPYLYVYLESSYYYFLGWFHADEFK